jgi:hypothetical protein
MSEEQKPDQADNDKQNYEQTPTASKNVKFEEDEKKIQERATKEADAEEEKD